MMGHPDGTSRINGEEEEGGMTERGDEEEE